MEKTIQKYDYIDALRGLAILGVVLVHTTLLVAPSGELSTLICANGARGVQLFFVASALTLFLSNDARRGDEIHPTRNFFIRRFFRIAPMYYLGIVISLLINGVGKQDLAPNGISWWIIGLNFLFLHGWHPEAINSVVMGGWSIAVEFMFYAVLPILFSRLTSLKSSLVFWAISTLTAFILTPLLVTRVMSLYPEGQKNIAIIMGEFWFFAQLPVFGVGVIVYHLIRRSSDLDPVLGYALLAISGILSVAFLSAKTYHGLLTQDMLYGLAFGFLTVGLYHNRLKLLVNPVTVWIGKLSFSIYLTHAIVIKFLDSFFNGHFPVKGGIGLVLGFLLILCISCGISYLTFTLIEKPGMRLGKKLIERLERPRFSPEASAG